MRFLFVCTSLAVLLAIGGFGTGRAYGATSACVKQCNDAWQACRRNCDATRARCYKEPLVPNWVCDNGWSGCMAQNCDPQLTSCRAACGSAKRRR